MKIQSFSLRKTTLKVLIGCLIVVVLIFIGSFIYYSNLNSAEDPRVVEAKNLQLIYDKGLEGDETQKALDLLDQMLAIYKGNPGYGDSYEVGVIYNNQATVYLVHLIPDLLLLQENLKDNKEKEINMEKILKNLDTAQEFTLQSIGVYESWLKEMGNLTETEIREKITPFFDPEDSAFKESDFKMVFEKRVEDIKISQFETKRRLSVSLTNLGVINRYKGNLQESKENYQRAIELWDRNYTAKDNLNMLMNLPKEKRSMLDRFFPPERVKDK
ncbi:MAG: hypothetical protein GY699_18730 [Desulfobacteraceae bacterium]|nr:hypothetical protein [Desulfobacteraceae bacterium]